MDLMMSTILAAVFPRIKRFQFVKFFKHTMDTRSQYCCQCVMLRLFTGRSFDSLTKPHCSN